MTFDLDNIGKPSAPEASGLDLALGLLTPAQVAAKMGPFFPKGTDPNLNVMRLIARGALPTVEVGGQTRITVDALAAFLKDGSRNVTFGAMYDLPPETLAPLFPISGTWFDMSMWQYWIEKFVGAIYLELEKQIPKNLAGGVYKPSWAPKLDLSAQITPALRAAIAAPVPSFNPLLPAGPDVAAFKGAAEIFLVSRLQMHAAREIEQRSTADSQNIKAQGIGPLYASPAAYRSIVEAAMVAFQQGSISLTRDVSQNDPAKANTMLPLVRVVLPLSDVEIMKLAGTNLIRLACLAF
ncbi:MAG: hypothetical protein WCI73_19860 [Phycisphaerae bacterium]